MRTILLVAMVTTLATTALAPIERASARPAPKPAELVTVGAVVHPERGPIEATRLSRVPRAALTAADAIPAAVKQPDVGTALPPIPENADQRAKLAAGLATAAPAPDLLTAPGMKPEERSTIVPAAPGSHIPTIEELMRLKLRFSAIDSGSRIEAPARSVSAALGTIPRPEWTAGRSPEKTRDVSTIGPAAVPMPVPNSLELERRAARTGTPPGVAPRATRKSGNVTTSHPRDPSLPPPSAAKAQAPEAPKEVQP